MNDANTSGSDSKNSQPDLREILGTNRNGRKKKSRRYLYAAAAIVLIGGGLGYYYQSRAAGVAYSYTTEAARQGDLSVIVTSTGSVQPTDQVDISSELSGTVRKVNVTYNSPVKAGDVLAELDTNKLEADVQSARAKLASAKASVLKARADLGSAKTSMERLRSLVQNRVSSQQDLDAAQFSHDAAAATLDVNEATVLSAEADLRLAEVNLGKAKIVSPIDGVILTRSVDPGATVASSLNAPVLFTIAGDLRHMELQVSVDEADVGKVETGQKANFNVDAYPDRSFPAEIETVRFASETVSNVVTYKGILTVDNEELLLRPGMTATANIIVEEIKDTLLVPNSALRYTPPRESASRGGGLMSLFRPPRMGRSQNRDAGQAAAGKRTVWVLRNNNPVSVAIETGSTDGQHTVVKSGELKADDQVITDATARNAG
ncbi:Multidrug resistance protein MdtA [Rhizobium rhizogenes]|uniref:Efflux RND transporter periplasmic adaptor subunit n=2 Tax=Rhizobium/Agrobacterium group TaxID=227290 RepID=A0A546XYN0_AGRTU|nr:MULTISPECIES: efflux RND transporter periplasmic adaptor subunit [Rhizobium/Agrobacterium group]AQS61511.1 efflux RND transporter periplasmic adaptor subunit [Rhizobium rhizogenes]MBO0124883.1 efflux RND transporter periplasmic adaptor subunit [Agrobacterium sp. OT33]MCZ7443305.1 efflux RND transporter periplasmic adaptor subunit [Rhizobium rhizogenes]NSX90953.1 efflux RND transporter periplasmic adaptor subunit [Agrobacterium tumefaciens]NSZ79291.1 efflux RND transporter periplasmic adapto